VLNNERPVTVPFPAWIDPSWHGCLVGCLDCQESCPENAPFLGQVSEEGEFTEEETAAIVDAVPRDRLPPALLEKLEAADLLCQLGILPRNLHAVLANTSGIK
jgi:epoxyqueuosine reductase